MFFHMVYKSGQIFLPFCHNPRVWRTDRRTDRILIARPRLHSMQRFKKINAIGGKNIAHDYDSVMKLGHYCSCVVCAVCRYCF